MGGGASGLTWGRESEGGGGWAGWAAQVLGGDGEVVRTDYIEVKTTVTQYKDFFEVGTSHLLQSFNIFLLSGSWTSRRLNAHINLHFPS